MSYFSADYLKPQYFAARYFRPAGEDEQERSGWWRLQLYKLQEESERKRKEKQDAADDSTVAKVIEPPAKVQVERPRKPAKPKTVEPAPDKFKLRPVYEPHQSVEDKALPLMLEVWAIMRETFIFSLPILPVKQLLLAKIEAANDEEDVELLLMAA